MAGCQEQLQNSKSFKKKKKCVMGSREIPFSCSVLGSASHPSLGTGTGSLVLRASAGAPHSGAFSGALQSWSFIS